jgi:hypothetical protein
MEILALRPDAGALDVLNDMPVADPFEHANPAAWLDQALRDLGARRARHPGHHRYTLTLDRRARAELQRAHRLRPIHQPDRSVELTPEAL